MVFQIPPSAIALQTFAKAITAQFIAQTLPDQSPAFRVYLSGYWLKTLHTPVGNAENSIYSKGRKWVFFQI
ncbi:hypothetical protein [Thalassorhabdomicrobium marinisediminis]|uniref:hypothetical protein n=1 Tax=Thalassorhabdomicrobium marinisediminis TaxID=2170577 RepID=UPI0011B1D5B7|nr:hypothetical protein [Thalassorhabdomicrobium marinisediminis]